MKRCVGLMLALVACGGGSENPTPGADPDAGGADAGETDASDESGELVVEYGLFLNNPDRTGPIVWMPVDDSGLRPPVLLAPEIPADTRRTVWGFSEDGRWLFYVVGQEPDQSVWARHLGGDSQRLDDGSKPFWSAMTHTADTVFFVGESMVAFASALGADGVAGAPIQVSGEGRRVFSVQPAPSGDFIAMHYYGFLTPIVRVVQEVNALGEDMAECCAFGYYWNLSPQWAHQADRGLMVAGPGYENRHLYVVGVDDMEPTPVHETGEHGGRYVVHAQWSADDQLIAYSTKMTLANFSNHLFIADVRVTPQRLEVTSGHTAGVSWRPGTNPRHVTYTEYPALNSQQRLMLGTVSLDPLEFSAVPIIEHEPSENFAIRYQWNANGTAILSHGGSAGAYTVTFVSPEGEVAHVPVGVHFRAQDSVIDWSIPHLSWSADGRRFVCRTNTGYVIGSIDVEAATIGPVIDLPADIHFAWFDRRLVRKP